MRWAMGERLLEHRSNEEILEEAKVELIVMVTRRRLELFRHEKKTKTGKRLRAVAEMKMEGKRPRGNQDWDGRTLSEGT